MTEDLQYFSRELFRYSITRKAVLFAVLFTATRSFKVSLVMAFAIIVFNHLAEKRQQPDIKEDKETQTYPTESELSKGSSDMRILSGWH